MKLYEETGGKWTYEWEHGVYNMYDSASIILYSAYVDKEPINLKIDGIRCMGIVEEYNSNDKDCVIHIVLPCF